LEARAVVGEGKLTHQGVRALGWSKRRRVMIPPDCDHRRIRWHCHPRNCGHLECPRCGLSWDVGAEA
jgi:putative ribosome biogenesis GTPase RsgA